VATRSPIAFHAYWGIFATYGDLPNVAGSSTQSDTLQVGDQAYSTADSMLYFCVNAASNAATWSAMGLGPANFDAFGRLRVSNPQTIFEGKTVYDAQPLYFAEQQTGGALAGSWSSADACVTLSVAANQSSIRQSRRYFNYQPGKSQSILQTFNLNGITANTTKRAGYFDATNGIFLELSGGVASFHRRSGSATASASENQSSWNLDPMDGTGPSGVNLAWNKTQILVIDFEWLGVGSIRCGFVVNGQTIYAHRFDNANIQSHVYMSTPNLPIRWEIVGGAGLVGSATLDCICAAVSSEGGVQSAGTQYSYVMPALTSNVAGGATRTLFSIRHTGAYPRVTIVPINISPCSDSNGVNSWELVYHPTFPVTAPTWGTVNQGYLDVDIVGQAVGGTVLEAGTFTDSVGAQNLNLRDTTLTLGADVAGTSDIISLRVKNLSGNNHTYIASLAWIAVT